MMINVLILKHINIDNLIFHKNVYKIVQTVKNYITLIYMLKIIFVVNIMFV